MMFADSKDSLRKDYNLRGSKIDAMLKRHDQLALPMPAFGETICKIRDKTGSNFQTVVSEIDRLIETNVVKTVYLQKASETYAIAKDLSVSMDDDRDQISPMDALIVASATTDPCCNIFYTTDSRLISDARVSEIIDEWREDRDGYERLSIRGISSILKAR